MPGAEEIFLESVRCGLSVRRQLHRQPELSGAEIQTAAYLRAEVERLGAQVYGLAQSPSFLAYLPGDRPGCVGFRAELDALPLVEASGNVPRSQVQGVMHACGHDLHCGLGVALLHALSRRASSQRRSLLLCFESSEEVLPGGARAILRAPAFIQRRPDLMLAFHVEASLPVGHVGLRAGAYMASGDEIYITVNGRGGHAGLPHLLRDPVVAAAQVLVALQGLNSRLAPPQVPSVLSFGHIECAGAMNLIPDRVRLDGTFRTMSEEWRAEALNHISRIAMSTAQALECEAEVDIRPGYPCLRNDPDLVEQARRLLPGAVEAIDDLDVRMTTDDFAFFSAELPSLYLRLGVDSPGGLHSTSFNPREEALGVGLAALLALFDGLVPHSLAAGKGAGDHPVS